MKKIFTFLLAVCATSVLAQTPMYSTLAGAGSNSFPFNSATNKCQNLYAPSDFITLPPSGLITKIYYRNGASSTTPRTSTDIRIAMGYASSPIFTSTTYQTGLDTVVYIATRTFPTLTVGEWIEYTLTTPFYYNNTQILLVQGSTNSSSGHTVRNNALADKRLYSAHTSATGTINSGMAEIGLDIMVATPCAAPTGLNAASVTHNSAALSWAAGTGTLLGYEYNVSTSATPPATGTFTASTSYAAGPLTPSTTYYLHVRTQCATTNFSGWTTLSFTTTAIPSCNAVSAPNITGISMTGANINWTAVGSAVGYEYAVNTNSTPPASGTATTGTSYNAGGLTSGTTYYVHLRSQCPGPLYSTWTTASFTTAYPPCAAPAPAVSNVTLDGATISWPAVAGAVGYQLAINNSATYPAAGANTTALSETVAGLTDNTAYYAHVRTNCGPGGYSPWVSIPFTTQSHCTPPTAIISNITDSKADINWNAMSGATAYEYVVTTNQMPPTSGTSIPGLNHNATQLLPDTKYYVHLASVCPLNRSTWSTSGFTTKSPTGISIVGGNIVRVYPNPVKDVLSIKLTEAEGMITLTDVAGKTISTTAVTNRDMHVDMTAVAKGVYFLKYTHNESVKTISIVKE